MQEESSGGMLNDMRSPFQNTVTFSFVRVLYVSVEATGPTTDLRRPFCFFVVPPPQANEPERPAEEQSYGGRLRQTAIEAAAQRRRVAGARSGGAAAGPIQETPQTKQANSAVNYAPLALNKARAISLIAIPRSGS